MLEIPRAITSPIDRVPMGTSWSNSKRSGIFRQAVTPTKPCGGVGGLTSANALPGGEDSGREGASGRWIGDLTGAIRKSSWDLPLGLKVQVGWGVSPAVITGQDGCSTLSIPQTLVFSPSVGVPAQGTFLECQWGKRLLNPFSLLPWGWPPLGKPPHQ